MAGPLANPVDIKHQIIGTIDERTARVVADALLELKTQGALVAWGEPGIDEISVTGKTGTLFISNGEEKKNEWNAPAHPGLDYKSLPGGDAQENSATFLKLLSGEETGPLLDMVCENAGAAIDLWNGKMPTPGGDGAKKARSLIENGAALRKFEEHRAAAKKLA